MHPFDKAIQLTQTQDHGFIGATSPDYANMVGPFGGIICAVMLNSVLGHPERIGDPVALTVNFAGPVPDGAFDIETRNTRTNRSTQHWNMQMNSGGQICVSASAIFAIRRDTWSVSEKTALANPPSPETLPREDLTMRPAWVHSYDLRFVKGGLPGVFEGKVQDDSETVVWIKDEPFRPLDFTSLAALSDCFYPRILIRRHKIVACGTVSLTTYFHTDAAALAKQADRYVLGTARALNFSNSYCDQNAEIWSDSGELLASSHQIVYYRE